MFRTRCLAIVPALATLALATTATAQQLPDAWLVPSGALRISFTAHYRNFDNLLDRDGVEHPIGAAFSADSVGPVLLPSLGLVEAAVRSMLDDPAYRVNAGALTTRMDADIRRFPFDAAVGITSRLTLRATVPIVRTRTSVQSVFDPAASELGWNPASSASTAQGTNIAQVEALRADLEAAAAHIESQIAAGAYGCPGSQQCADANALVQRARRFSSDIMLLTGVGAPPGSPLPPFVPRSGSTAGAGLLVAIAALSAELQAFGAQALSSTLPLPTTAPDTAAIQTVLTGPEFGYVGLALRDHRRSTIGDIELGARFGLINRPGLRTVLTGTVRLPTGFMARDGAFIEIGTGDGQTDVEWGVEVAAEPGTHLGLWLGARYTMQLADRIATRVSSINRPIALAVDQRTMERNLGDIFELSVHPSLRLTDQFRVMTSLFYRRKQEDVYGLADDDTPTVSGLVPADMSMDTKEETWSLGGAVWYRADRGAGGPALPIEAGISYRSVFRSGEGRAPRTNAIEVSLRLFYRIW